VVQHFSISSIAFEPWMSRGSADEYSLVGNILTRDSALGVHGQTLRPYRERKAFARGVF